MRGEKPPGRPGGGGGRLDSRFHEIARRGRVGGTRHLAERRQSDRRCEELRLRGDTMKRLLLVIAVLMLSACATPPATPPVMSSGKTEVWWLGQAAFRITTPGGKVIVIDPWVTN